MRYVCVHMNNVCVHYVCALAFYARVRACIMCACARMQMHYVCLRACIMCVCANALCLHVHALSVCACIMCVRA